MQKLRQIIFFVVILAGLPVALYLVGRVTGFFGKASGTPANLVVDAGVAFSDSKFVWQNLAQGGEEDGRMLASVIEKTKSLRPQYIRLDHVFDYYGTAKKEGGQVVFNWTKLDETIRDIQAIGARPYIALSYMPPSFTQSGSTIDDPINWSDWELTVQRTVEHISGRGGLNISNVYYEVWNEPDLFGSYKTYGGKNYLNLYAHSVAGANRAGNVNPYKIGGPATTALYENWVRSFLKFTSQNNLRIDFYSWHKYTKDMDQIEQDMVKFRSWLNEFPNYQNIEAMITEIGPNSAVDKVYDNGFGAIHTLATSAVLEDKIDRMFLFEIKDGPGPEKNWGRWGMFTHDKFGEPTAKPRVSAVQFLNRMIGGRLNTAGQGSWVKAFSKKDGNTVRTFVVNYDPNGGHTEVVPITFVNLPLSDPTSNIRNFRFRRINYSGAAGRDLQISTDSASWSTLENFNANTAAIFEITPQ